MQVHNESWTSCGSAKDYMNPKHCQRILGIITTDTLQIEALLLPVFCPRIGLAGRSLNRKECESSPGAANPADIGQYQNFVFQTKA